MALIDETRPMQISAATKRPPGFTENMPAGDQPNFDLAFQFVYWGGVEEYGVQHHIKAGHDNERSDYGARAGSV